MPPLSVNCNQNLVTSWISNIDRDNTAWFEEKAKEHRQGKGDSDTDVTHILKHTHLPQSELFTNAHFRVY